ncbi:MAG: response regulator [Chloroflexi bacterium]|nr:response regulator [Chloroflexota bacterium]
MSEPDELRRENALLRERLTRLSEASLLVNDSLDFSTVLLEVVRNASSLTGARYGGMSLLDESGEPEDFVSHGLTPEEHQQLLNLPDREWLTFMDHFTNIHEPLRLPNVGGYIESLGLSSPMQLTSFVGTPIRHRGMHLGTFYLANKEDVEEFTNEDEEILVLFASQAASAIVNARKYRDEQRARAYWETMIDTSPVGVVVFDANTGKVLSINREARRIVSVLNEPDGTAEELLDVMTFRRADGHEISLSELPLTQLLRANSESVRAEEMVLMYPGGRSVTTLVNSTPMHSDDGTLEAVIVIVQDMSPLEELERLRSEFLGTVSHELRTPLTSIRGSATTLLDDGSSLHPAEMRQFFRIIVEQADRMRELISNLLDVARIETGTLPVEPVLASVSELVDEARNTFVSAGGRNDIRIDLASELPMVMADRLRTVQVLGNLLSNAARYSPESTPIVVSAERQDLHVAVSVIDRGRGVPDEELPYLFGKFFRLDATEQRSGHDGSGLGLAISKGIVEAQGGRIWVNSEGPDTGTRFTFTIPIAEESSGSGIERIRPSSGTRRPEKEPLRVLVIDDDPQALRYIRGVLTSEGYAPILTGDPTEVLGLMEANEPHLVLMDLRLPGIDGIELMRDITSTVDVPVIFVSAYGQEEHVTRAFDMGASDYIVKPFSPSELAARIRASLRKGISGRTGPVEPYVLGDLAIHYSQRRVTVAGRATELTPIEFRLLFELSVNAGRVMGQDELFRRIWGPTHSAEPHSLRSFVKKLRNKLGDDAKNPRYIFTHAGMGYRMPDPRETYEG